MTEHDDERPWLPPGMSLYELDPSVDAADAPPAVRRSAAVLRSRRLKVELDALIGPDPDEGSTHAEALLPVAQRTSALVHALLGETSEQTGDSFALALRLRNSAMHGVQDEVLDQNLADLLLLLGHVPPPSAAQLEEDLKDALERALTADTARADSTRRTLEVALFCYADRLDRLIADTRRGLARPTGARPATLRRHLAKAARILGSVGVKNATAAALSAAGDGGVTAVLTTLSAATQTTLKDAVTLASDQLSASILAQDALEAPAPVRLAALLGVAAKYTQLLIEAGRAGSVAGAPDPLVRAITLTLVSTFYEAISLTIATSSDLAAQHATTRIRQGLDLLSSLRRADDGVVTSGSVRDAARHLEQLEHDLKKCAALLRAPLEA
ncbi:hypothetical protein [Cellulosimicrobium funkei]|uniref:hypothetical protein n=1 Tax=Cellulosimicrobium funkei TaxID=264251 RepID=UPI00369A6CF6